jgi:hypothetical protein
MAFFGLFVSKKKFESVEKDHKKLVYKNNDLERENKRLELELRVKSQQLSKYTSNETDEVILGKNWKPENTGKPKVNTEFGTPKNKPMTKKQAQKSGIPSDGSTRGYNNHNDLMNPANPLSPLSPINVYDTTSYDSSPSKSHDSGSSSSSYDSGSSSSSYDSGSSSSYDSGSSW